jgi:hypothetical protein
MIAGFCVPPISGFMYTKDDWIDLLLSRHFDEAVTVPSFEPSIPPQITGLSFETSQHQFFSILEDLEIVSIQERKERLVLDNPVSMHKFRRMIDPTLRYGGYKPVVIVSVLKDIPPQFSSYIRSPVVLSDTWVVSRQI